MYVRDAVYLPIYYQVYFSDEKVIDVQELPRTKSGRLVKPILAWWADQRVVVHPNIDDVAIVSDRKNTLIGTPVNYVFKNDKVCKHVLMYLTSFLFFVEQHDKTRVFLPLDIKIFYANWHFNSKLFIRIIFFENGTNFSFTYFKNQWN